MTIKELTKLHTQLYLQMQEDWEIKYYNTHHVPDQEEFENTVMDYDREGFNLHERLSLFMTKDYENGVPQWLLNDCYEAFCSIWNEALELEIESRDYARECRDIDNENSRWS